MSGQKTTRNWLWTGYLCITNLAAINYVLKDSLSPFTLGFFPVNCCMVSDKNGESFYQDIAIMETRYHRNWSTSMLADYCWNLTRDNTHIILSSHTRYKQSSVGSRGEHLLLHVIM